MYTWETLGERKEKSKVFPLILRKTLFIPTIFMLSCWRHLHICGFSFSITFYFTFVLNLFFTLLSYTTYSYTFCGCRNFNNITNTSRTKRPNNFTSTFVNNFIDLKVLMKFRNFSFSCLNSFYVKSQLSCKNESNFIDFVELYCDEWIVNTAWFDWRKFAEWIWIDNELLAIADFLLWKFNFFHSI